jgi:hypothetical protein
MIQAIHQVGLYPKVFASHVGIFVCMQIYLLLGIGIGEFMQGIPYFNESLVLIRKSGSKQDQYPQGYRLPGRKRLKYFHIQRFMNKKQLNLTKVTEFYPASKQTLLL